jgi:hypothetical protein
MYRTDQDYIIDLVAWKLHHDTKKKLLQQLLAAVDNIFTKALKNNLWGYARTTTLALLTHLAGTYGKISPEDMIANRVQLNHPWTPPQTTLKITLTTSTRASSSPKQVEIPSVKSTQSKPV